MAKMDISGEVGNHGKRGRCSSVLTACFLSGRVNVLLDLGLFSARRRPKYIIYSFFNLNSNSENLPPTIYPSFVTE